VLIQEYFKMADKIKEKYAELGKKYSLPKFGELDSAFEISGIEDGKVFLLRKAIGKIAEKVDYYSGLLEHFMQPDPSSLSGMHELKFFSEEEKLKVYSVFKRLIKLNRSAIEADLSQDERKEAEYISLSLDEWKKLREELIPIVKKIRESWDKDSEMEEKLGYFG